MEHQKLMMQLSMFEQQIKQIQQQLELVERSIGDLITLSEGLDSIKGSKEKEIFAQIGNGIFVKAKVLSEDLVVDIGERNFVGKSIPETKKIIEEQNKRLGEAKIELERAMEEISKQLTDVMLNSHKETK